METKEMEEMSKALEMLDYGTLTEVTMEADETSVIAGDFADQMHDAVEKALFDTEMQDRGFLIYNEGKAYIKVATDKDGRVIPHTTVANREEALDRIREEMAKDPEFEFLARISFKNNYHVQDFMEKIVTAPDVTKAEGKAVAHFQEVFANDRHLRGNTFEIIMLPGCAYKECIKEHKHS